VLHGRLPVVEMQAADYGYLVLLCRQLLGRLLHTSQMAAMEGHQ